MTQDSQEPQDKYIEIDGLRLHYLDWGNPEGQPMILMHGLQDCARGWDAFSDSLRSEYHVIALDSRGHGDSGWTDPKNYRFRNYVSDLEELVKQLGLEKIILVGHSAGGRYTFTYASENPDKVEYLIVVDIDPDPINPDSQGMFQRYNAESDKWESLDAVIERLRTRQPRSIEAMLEHQAQYMTKEIEGGKLIWKRDRKILEAYQRPDLWDIWSKITSPTLIVRGRQSNLLTHEVAVRMREAIPRARLAELEGGGHWFYQEAPGAFEATVRWFLDSPP